MKRIAVIGAGGHAKELSETLTAVGVEPHSISYYVDSQFRGDSNHQLILYNIKELVVDDGNTEVYLAVGSGALRESFFKRLGEKASYPTLIHPTAIIGHDCHFGKGTQVQQLSTVTANVQIGNFAQLNIQVGISHDCRIGDFFTASPRVNLSGNVTVGNHVFIGTAAVILPGITICDHVVIGAGAVVTKDITEPGTYVGVPAKRIS